MVGLGMMGEFLYLKRKIYLESVSNKGISKPYHILVDNSFWNKIGSIYNSKYIHLYYISIEIKPPQSISLSIPSPTLLPGGPTGPLAHQSPEHQEPGLLIVCEDLLYKPTKRLNKTVQSSTKKAANLLISTYSMTDWQVMGIKVKPCKSHIYHWLNHALGRINYIDSRCGCIQW